jgi:hypothetical protein
MRILFNTIVVSIILLITGCLNYVQEVILFPDGSGKMHIDYWMILPDEDSRNVADKIGIFNPDSIRNEFSSKYSKINNVEVYTDTTDSTTHAIVDFTFDRIDSLNLTKAFTDARFSFKEGASGQINFTQFIPPITTGFGIDASKYNVTYKYTFSGSIITHNAHEVDKRELTWNYSLSDIGGGKTITVTFRPFKLKETPDWIYMLTGAVLALVIFFLIRKKKD